MQLIVLQFIVLCFNNNGDTEYAQSALQISLPPFYHYMELGL